MRIIRPQQLVVLKNSYQIGYESHMGVSVVAGCYLSKPEHLVTEPQIWQAWKSAPLSLKMLDSAEPKPFAEFLLAGHVGIGEEVTSLYPEVTVGAVTRRWCIEGEGSKTGLGIKPFLRIPMDHTQSWGGKGCKENPLGRGYGDDHKPTVMSIGVDGSATVRSPLAASTPVPYEFQLRKAHLDAVASSLNDPKYLETFYPGLPPNINRRYFQMAPPDQWLKKAEWPDNVPFRLTGFRPQNEVISGIFPSVTARAFVWNKAIQSPSELTLQRKTLWLLPDDDIGLMVFTGSLPLTHLFDEPVETLLVGMDYTNQLRSMEHYQWIYKKRSVTDASTFEFLKDTDLMPTGMSFNVIRDLTDHPDSLRYNATTMPQIDIDSFYQNIQEAIEAQDRLEAEGQDTLHNLKIPSSGSDEMATHWLASGEEAAINILFSGSCLSGIKLDNKSFRHCTFNNSSFDNALLNNCTFEHCQFIEDNFAASCWNSVSFTDCLFRKTDWQKAHFDHCKWEKITFEHVMFQQGYLIGNYFDNCLINNSNFSICQFEDCLLRSCFLSESQCQQAIFNHSNILSCVFDECDVSQAHFTESTVEKTSIISSQWGSVRFSQCYFNSVTTGLNTDLSETYFEHCSMNKMGFLSANLQSSTFTYCSILESCCDKADLSQATLNACDMTAVRLKDAQLTHSQWQSTSLQQGLLYNADLRDAHFLRCNLAGANLAMINQNMNTFFEYCLTEKTHWIPRRYRASA